MLPSTQFATPPVYAPGAFRLTTDRERNALDRFVNRYPEYSKLPPSVLAQYAVTYRDDRDHALEQEFRDNGVLDGARADFGLSDRDWDDMPTSDNAFSEEQS